jgi:short-subunit dehydrogenase
MEKKLAVVVGAGKGMGVNMAKVFGQHDFKVAMLARNLDKLAPLAEELNAQGIEAYTYAADAVSTDSLTAALPSIPWPNTLASPWTKRRFGHLPLPCRRR